MNTSPNKEVHLRGGTNKIDRYKWTLQDEPGEFGWINKDLLEIDHTYQRDAKESKVLGIARDWSWVACGAIIVAERADGSLYVIEGQHRVCAAMRRADISAMPCLVFRSKSILQEAKGFMATNTLRKNMGALDRFKPLLAMGDPAAKLAESLFKQAGRTPGRSSNAATIQCVNLVVKLATQKPEVLQRVWSLIVDACAGDTMHEKVVDGIVYLESQLPDGVSLTHKKWRARIVDLGARGLLEAANKAAAFYTRGGAKVWAVGILEAVNKGMRQRLEMESSE